MPRNHRQHIPVDASVTVDCPRCLCDVDCYVMYGLVESMECANDCHTHYTDDQRASVEALAKNAAESELHELEFRTDDDAFDRWDDR